MRGDSIVRVGDLSTNVWKSITQAGVIVAEVSVPNPNVYYEIGLADAWESPYSSSSSETPRYRPTSAGCTTHSTTSPTWLAPGRHSPRN